MRATELPARKPVRLINFDYSTPGTYFITICTREKRCILSRVVKPSGGDVGAAISRPPTCTLTKIGETVRRTIENIPDVYPAVSVDRYVIMPNHIHMLLSISSGDGGRQIAAPTISTVVGQMKRQSSLQTGSHLWQRAFYDHIVRNESEYREIAEYIDNNPAKWAEDRFYIPE